MSASSWRFDSSLAHQEMRLAPGRAYFLIREEENRGFGGASAQAREKLALSLSEH